MRIVSMTRLESRPYDVWEAEVEYDPEPMGCLSFGFLSPEPAGRRRERYRGNLTWRRYPDGKHAGTMMECALNDAVQAAKWREEEAGE